MSSSRSRAEKNMSSYLNDVRNDDGGVTMGFLSHEAVITTVVEDETTTTTGFEIEYETAMRLISKLPVGMGRERPFKVYDLKTDRKHDVKLILNTRNRYIVDWHMVGSSPGQKIRFDFHYGHDDDPRIGLFFAHTRY